MIPSIMIFFLSISLPYLSPWISVVWRFSYSPDTKSKEPVPSLDDLVLICAIVLPDLTHTCFSTYTLLRLRIHLMKKFCVGDWLYTNFSQHSYGKKNRNNVSLPGLWSRGKTTLYVLVGGMSQVFTLPPNEAWYLSGSWVEVRAHTSSQSFKLEEQLRLGQLTCSTNR